MIIVARIAVVSVGVVGWVRLGLCESERVGRGVGIGAGGGEGVGEGGEVHEEEEEEGGECVHCGLVWRRWVVGSGMGGGQVLGLVWGSDVVAEGAEQGW